MFKRRNRVEQIEEEARAELDQATQQTQDAWGRPDSPDRGVSEPSPSPLSDHERAPDLMDIARYEDEANAELEQVRREAEQLSGRS